MRNTVGSRDAYSWLMYLTCRTHREELPHPLTLRMVGLTSMQESVLHPDGPWVYPHHTLIIDCSCACQAVTLPVSMGD